MTNFGGCNRKLHCKVCVITSDTSRTLVERINRRLVGGIVFITRWSWSVTNEVTGSATFNKHQIASVLPN